jgi:co-chaperonin GroES (HSP10)
VKFPVTPLGELCFIAPESLDGLIQTLDPGKSFRGRIVAAGPGRPMPDGSAAPMDVKVGDVVRIKQGNAVEGIFDRKMHWIVRESDLLAVEA